ncbi:MAG: helix-turn-helix domain-containing protein [Akkermansiaceae bacterium]|nr:helix-turn-helix domain-containing protein [Akkermansiaceae bacterium]
MVLLTRPFDAPHWTCPAKTDRKNWPAGLSQAQLGEAVGVPARSITFYERKTRSVPSHLVPRFAEALSCTVEEVLGIKPPKAVAKRGPTSKIQQLAEDLSKLPKSKQRLIVQMLEGFLHAS